MKEELPRNPHVLLAVFLWSHRLLRVRFHLGTSVSFSETPKFQRGAESPAERQEKAVKEAREAAEEEAEKQAKAALA